MGACVVLNRHWPAKSVLAGAGEDDWLPGLVATGNRWVGGRRSRVASDVGKCTHTCIGRWSISLGSRDRRAPPGNQRRIVMWLLGSCDASGDCRAVGTLADGILVFLAARRCPHRKASPQGPARCHHPTTQANPVTAQFLAEQFLPESA